MDILNWLYLKKQQLIKTTPDSTSDLVVLGADATFAKRGDKYQSYAMPLKDVATQYDDAGTAGTTVAPIENGQKATLNGYTGRIVIATDALAGLSKVTVALENDKIAASNNRILLSVGYSGSSGAPIAWYGNIDSGGGQMDITVYNTDPDDVLNSTVVVTFEILPQ